MQKTLIILAIALCALLATPVLAAQELSVAEIQAAWAKEPSLIQADIDNYLKVWPQLMDHARAGLDKEAFRPVFAENGWNDVHGSYVLAKMNMSLLIIDAPDLEEKLARSMPPNAMPTTDELELVKQNHARIMQIQQDYINNIKD